MSRNQHSGDNRKSSDPIASVVSFTNTSYRNDANALNLNELVVKNPNSTYFMKIEGEAWSDRGVYPGDILVIDRSLSLKKTDMVVAEIDGEFVLARFDELENNPESRVWGVITYTLHKRR